MRRVRTGLFLAGIQVIIATALLLVGRQQMPRIVQDSPLFVGPAIKVCFAINAPVTLAEFGAILLLEKAGVNLGLHAMAWMLSYLIGVWLLWFVIGLEISRMLKTSVITPKAANEYHFKTGQPECHPGHWIFYTANN